MKSKKSISLIALLFILITCSQAFSATYTYDNANRLTGVDLGNGFTINYTYDAAGNRTSMSYNDTAAPTGSVIINGGAESTPSASVILNFSV